MGTFVKSCSFVTQSAAFKHDKDNKVLNNLVASVEKAGGKIRDIKVQLNAVGHSNPMIGSPMTEMMALYAIIYERDKPID